MCRLRAAALLLLLLWGVSSLRSGWLMVLIALVVLLPLIPLYFVLLGVLWCPLGRFVLLGRILATVLDSALSFCTCDCFALFAFCVRCFNAKVRSAFPLVRPGKNGFLLFFPMSGWLFSPLPFFLAPLDECVFLIASRRVRVRLWQKRSVGLDGF